MAESPWAKFEARTWKKEIAELGGMEVTFRESGSAVAAIRLSSGSLSASDEEATAARLVCTSVIDPHLSEPEFHALSLTAKLALLAAISERAEATTDPDFPESSEKEDGTGPPEQATAETTDGGPGVLRRPSVSVAPRTSS